MYHFTNAGTGHVVLGSLGFPAGVKRDFNDIDVARLSVEEKALLNAEIQAGRFLATHDGVALAAFPVPLSAGVDALVADPADVGG